MTVEGVYRFFYRLQDHGDGSASVAFHSSLEEAQEAEREAMENGDGGWSEPTATSENIYVDKSGRLSRKEGYYSKEANAWLTKYIPLERIV